MKTTKTKLKELKAAHEEAAKAYYSYRSEYNKEHGIEGGTIIKEIIALCKKGKTNAEIVELGYNKNTVKRQVNLFKKRIRVEKTTVKQYLPPKKNLKKLN